MTVHQIGPAIFDLNVPRMEPCRVIVAPAEYCGATPTSLFRKRCVRVESHSLEVWLCIVHAALGGVLSLICRQCAEKGVVSFVEIERISAPIRL
jgi:hypothetical protein